MKKVKKLSPKWQELLGKNIWNYPEYEFRSLAFAERYGIVDYTVKGNIMKFKKSYVHEGTYTYKVDLDTMEQTVFSHRKPKNKKDF